MVRSFSCFLILLSLAAPAAEVPEQLDVDFLEYLADLEGDDDDWTLVAEAEEVRSAAKKDADAKASKPAKQAKQADSPAVDER